MQNPRQARVINPILTKVAQGHKHPARVGHLLFPEALVTERGGTVLEFGKESFRRYKTRLAHGGTRKSVSFGYEGKPFTLVKHALDAQVTEEQLEEAGSASINATSLAVQGVLDIISLDIEMEQAAIALNEANYDSDHKVTLSGTSQWTHADSNPAVQIRNARAAIRASTGFYPNVAIIGAKVFDKLDEHPKIMERLKYTTSDSITETMLANLWKIDKVAVGAAIYADEDDEFADVWDSSIVLAYVNIAPVADRGSPSYGYTYRLKGRPMVKKSWFDDKTDSHMHPVEDVCAPVLAAAGAGYLIKNVV